MSPDLPRDVVALVNGGPPSNSIMLSRALHYGDGVFRTLLRFDGRWLDFDRHYVKLVQDCQKIHLDAPHLGQLAAELDAVGGGRSTPVVGKIILARNAGGRGYSHNTRQCERIVLRYPSPRFSLRHWQDGIAVVRSPVVLGQQPSLAGIKHLNRLENVLASRGWPQEVQEVLLCDTQGQLICGSRSNVFWVADGQLHTPLLNQCGVAGVMRAKIIDIARSLGLAVKVLPADYSVLHTASEVFVCNSVFGIWPVKQLDDRLLPKTLPLTRQLMEIVAHPMLIEV